MKNYLLLLSALSVFAMSCNNVEQYRAPIEALTAEWTKAAETVNTSTTNLTTAANFLSTYVDSFKIDSTKKWSKVALMKMDTAKTAFVAQLQGVNGLVNEANEFKAKWTSMSADVDALTAGLKSGKLEGDVMVKINDLKANCAMALTQTEGWSKNVMGAQTTAMNAWDMFKSAMMMK